MSTQSRIQELPNNSEIENSQNKSCTKIYEFKEVISGLVMAEYPSQQFFSHVWTEALLRGCLQY